MQAHLSLIEGEVDWLKESHLRIEMHLHYLYRWVMAKGRKGWVDVR